MFTHILVPTDGSMASEAALIKAALLADALGSKLTALNVVGTYHTAYESEGFLMPELKSLRDRFEREEAKHSKKILLEAQKITKQSGTQCEVVSVINDAPYRAIVEQAEQLNCDAIVMASHGRRGIEGLLLGSVTQHVLTHSKLPVLVCH